MAHLINVLAAGVNGAENGTAEIYSRGTSTRATYYTDFEMTSAGATADVTLDSNGGATVYVLEYVTVTVKSSSGATVRTFTDGVSASDVEVISDSFTGADYDDADAGVNKPITLAAILDKWNDSAGTTGLNWLVDISGTGTNLSTAFSSILAPYTNVKDQAYGAAGDGVTDDTAAIQAAEAVADDSGGVLYFPRGSYKITSDIDISSNVQLMGEGPDASIIVVDNAVNADGLSFSSSTLGCQKIVGLRFTCAQANTDSFLALGANSRVLIENCHFVGTNLTGEAIDAFTAAPDYLIIKNSLFVLDASASEGVKSESINMFINGCVFEPAANYNSDCVWLVKGVVNDNIFRFPSGNAGAAANYIHADNAASGEDVIICGNRFFDDGASSVRAIELNDFYGANAGVKEYGNNIICGAYRHTVAGGSALTPADTNVAFASRKGRVKYYNLTPAGAGTETLSALNYEVHIIHCTNANNFTLDVDAMPPMGSRLVVINFQDSVQATGTITWDATDFITEVGGNTFTVPSDQTEVQEFISCPNSDGVGGYHLVFAKVANTVGDQA